MDDRWIEIGSIGRPHGVKGAMHAFLLNPGSSWFQPGTELAISDVGTALPTGDSGGEGASAARLLTVEWAKRSARGWIVKWRGVDLREVSAALTNKRLFVRRSQLPALGEDEVYQADLIGLPVWDLQGRHLGTIIGFFDNGAHEVCVIETLSGTEALVPFDVDRLQELPSGDRGVVLDVPEGIPGLEDVK